MNHTRYLAAHNCAGRACLGSGEPAELDTVYDTYGREKTQCTVCMMKVRVEAVPSSGNNLALSIDRAIADAVARERAACAEIAVDLGAYDVAQKINRRG